MRSYTNAAIPYHDSTVRTLRREKEELAFKLERSEKERAQLEDEMRNIFRAVQEWGYVDLFCELENKTIKLVMAGAAERKEQE